MILAGVRIALSVPDGMRAEESGKVEGGTASSLAKRLGRITGHGGARALHYLCVVALARSVPDGLRNADANCHDGTVRGE